MSVSGLEAVEKKTQLFPLIVPENYSQVETSKSSSPETGSVWSGSDFRFPPLTPLSPLFHSGHMHMLSVPYVHRASTIHFWHPSGGELPIMFNLRLLKTSEWAGQDCVSKV